ncbi:MAG: TolC family protein [Deltaproteobacteria bacterium]|nr:TolC family protein [Deltaproteobacteria bacterium]
MAREYQAVLATGALVVLVSACAASSNRAQEAPWVPRGKPQRSGNERERVLTAEASLPVDASLESILAVALARNPELLAAEARVEESLARVPIASRLPDLELKQEIWAVPLSRPWDITEAGMIMLGVRQAFPPRGSREAQARAAREEVEIARSSLQGLKLDVIARAKRSYFEYAAAHGEAAIHLEHAGITEKILELTRVYFRTGKVSEQDVLRVGVALVALHKELANIEQRRLTSIARLNTLMGRTPGAVLGPPAEPNPMVLGTQVDELIARAKTERPEIAAARHAVNRSEAERQATDRTTLWPTIMVGADYWLQPTMEPTHAYAAMVSINLPWLNPKRREEAEAARRAVVAERRMLEALDNSISGEVAAAHARYEGALKTHRIVTEDLLPAARKSFDAAQAGFVGGQVQSLALLDALSALLEVRLSEVRARLDLLVALVELRRAVGDEMEKNATTSHEVTQ